MKRKTLVVLMLLVMSLGLIFTYVDAENSIAGKDVEHELHSVRDYAGKDVEHELHSIKDYAGKDTEYEWNSIRDVAKVEFEWHTIRDPQV